MPLRRSKRSRISCSTSRSAIGTGHSRLSSERTAASTEQEFTQEWMGTNGGLRAFSGLEKYDVRPLHATDTEAQMRARLDWATPVGPVEDVRDFHLVKRGDQWKVVWDETPPPNVPAQVIPVNYLRWDLGQWKCRWERVGFAQC